MNCPCCSGKTYQDCCQPFHIGKEYASTAETLMRSRFSAFAIPNGDYLMETTLPTERKLHNTEDLQEWGEINDWTKLEIIKVSGKNLVEFKAHYKDENRNPHIHHEISFFEKLNNRWYYVSGKFLD
jgi:SEC-C motif-containing protein